MIARVWRGWTAPASADAYEQMLQSTILPGIAGRAIPGYHGAYLYRRTDGERVEFMTTLLFESLAAVRAFAGEDYERAVIHPDADALLTAYDERSAHYEVLLVPATSPAGAR